MASTAVDHAYSITAEGGRVTMCLSITWSPASKLATAAARRLIERTINELIPEPEEELSHGSE
jgi:hypothetical protein